MPTGRFFAKAGDRSLDADLYELTFGPVKLRRLTSGARVTTIGACPDRLIAAAAQKEVGFQDTLQEFTGGGLRPIAGLAEPKGSLPALSPDCRLVYTTVDRSTDELINQLNLWDPKRNETAALHRAINLGVPDWGPGGRVAVAEVGPYAPGVEPSATGIVVFEPDGSKKTLPAPSPALGAFQWGSSRWMALSEGTDRTLFFEPQSGETRRLPGWLPLAWSPEGNQLLVVNARDQRRLGVVDAADLSSVREVGAASANVFDVVWLPPDAKAGR